MAVMLFDALDCWLFQNSLSSVFFTFAEGKSLVWVGGCRSPRLMLYFLVINGFLSDLDRLPWGNVSLSIS